MTTTEITVVFLGDLHGGGGAQAVCMNILETLQQDYEVTLMTTQEPNLEELNSYYGTTVRNINIKLLELGPFNIKDLLDKVDSSLLRLPGPTIYLTILTSIILHRFCRRRLSDEDFIVTAYYDFPYENKAIQYIHFPVFGEYISPSNQDSPSKTRPIFHRSLGKLCRYFGKTDRKLLNNSRIIANSEWTADLVRSISVLPERAERGLPERHETITFCMI